MHNSLLGDLLASIFQSRRSHSPIGHEAADLASLCRALLGTRGELSGVALAQSILEAYRALDAPGRGDFFTMLANELEIDADTCLAAATTLAADRSPANLAAMRAAAEPARQELLRRLNLAPGGTEALVRMREDLLRLLPDRADLASVDDDFLHLFASWFNRGFLVLRRMSWSSPAALLEKIIAYEAVHAIAGWPELRRRVEPSDRLCHAFFHPAMPAEPLIVIEVALTAAIPDHIDALLSEGRETLPAERATVACFYSISNCQPGLRGVSFGNFLIKQVAQELAAAYPGLATFVTLSPIPGFARWLAQIGSPLPPEDDARREAMMRLAARYLVEETRQDGQPLDPVARFHLGNGARLQAIRWAADPGQRGNEQSFGMMANYLYDLDEIEDNHEAFRESSHVAVSPAVKALLRNRGHEQKRWPILSMTG